MLTINNVKNYIRADEDDDIIKMMIAWAKGYMEGAIDNFDALYEDADRHMQAKADIAMLELIACRYENRGELNASIPQSARDIITQLQLDGVKYEKSKDSGIQG